MQDFKVPTCSKTRRIPEEVRYFHIFRNIESTQQNELSKAKNRLAKLQREKMALEKVRQKKIEDARKLVVKKDEFLPQRIWTIENLDG